MNEGWADWPTAELDPPSWTLTELAIVPTTEHVGRPGSRWTGLLLALVAGMVSTGFAMSVVLPRVTDRAAELDRPSGSAAAGGGPNRSPGTGPQLTSVALTGDGAAGSRPTGDVDGIVVLSPDDGVVVGPGVVEVRARVSPPIRRVSVGVFVGSTVVGRVNAAVPPGGLVSVEVAVLGPGAGVPARIRVWPVDQGSGLFAAGESTVTLAAAPPVGVWRAGSDGPHAARQIVVRGDAALVVGTVRIDLRAGSRRIAGAKATIAADGDGIGVPFGRGRWAATLAVPASLADGDGRSLLLEISWPTSAAGPAGSTNAVVVVGDDRSADR